MTASFITSAARVDQLPDHDLCEIAFVGRSNVGKSSLLGALLGQSKLVRTSRTPGRTQLLNLFTFQDKFALVDLPGYGYAKLSKLQRRQLHTMIRTYVKERQLLRGLVLVLDARREAATADDQAMAAWAMQQGRALLLAVTKADCVAKPRRLHQARRLEQSIGAPAGSAVLCSGHTQEGLEELYGRLAELAGG
jgi:GTP-binding protein